MAHLKLAFRTLAKTPFVTVVAILSLALGIGANAAIFSLFEQTLLRPLPVADPDRLVNLSAPGPKPGSQSCNQAGDCEAVFSYAMFRDLEGAVEAFSGVAAHRSFSANLATGERTLSGEGMLVSGSYFPLLGLTPAAGRLIAPADDRAPGQGDTAVLSHDFWRQHLGGDPDVAGDTLVVNGRTLTIVGVAPAGFTGTTLGARPDVFVPLSMRAALESFFQEEHFDNRRNYWAYVFARLAPGATLESARAEANGVYRRIVNEVEAPLQEGMSEQTLERFRAKELGLEPGARGQSGVHEEAGTPLTLLLAITGVVLLIACANIANLLLARGAGRQREMAIRTSLGAGRGVLLRQLLTESVLLATVGAAAGLLVARWTLGLVGRILPPDAVHVIELQISPPMILFAAALAVATVAVVNAAFAEKFGLDPRQTVGKFMSSGGADELDTRIVGLVADARYSEVKQDVPPQFFTPYRQDFQLGFLTFYLRTAVPPESVMTAVTGLVKRLDPNLPVEELKTMEQQVRESVFLDRMLTTLSAAFAVLATLLAAIGLYGVLAYSVTQRTREIGVQMALGAGRRNVLLQVLAQTGRMVAVGGIVGVLAALALGRAAGSLLYGLEGTDPAVTTAGAGLLVLVALTAGLLPAYRASRVDPMEALRYE